MAAEHANSGDDQDVITIKKYANRRLYNTATSSYVTLDYLAQMIRDGQHFTVHDAKTGDDITRNVLTQIIFEEENKGSYLLPTSFLRDLIGYYGDNMQSFVPSYLEMSMESFRRNQEAMRQSMSEAFSGSPGFRMIEDVTRKNMAMFEQGMKMFGLQTPATTSTATETEQSLRAEIAELKRELAAAKSAEKKAGK